MMGGGMATRRRRGYVYTAVHLEWCLACGRLGGAGDGTPAGRPARGGAPESAAL